MTFMQKSKNMEKNHNLLVFLKNNPLCVIKHNLRNHERNWNRDNKVIENNERD